jgi:asparagine synthase (glutamine-hydrolysing)
MYKGLTSTWQHPDELVLRAPEAQSSIMNSRSWPDLHDITNQMMYLDVVTYLPDDILVKVDRASMSASLETRVPFLDPEVLEFAWRLPLEWKVRNDEGKWILRQLLYRYVPKDLVERPKKGFGVPIGEWLRGPLRDWAESLMETERLKEQGYLNPTVVNECWQSHLSGSRFSPAKLWNVLMFQAWLEEYC